jgi:hypothetical protein
LGTLRIRNSKISNLLFYSVVELFYSVVELFDSVVELFLLSCPPQLLVLKDDGDV